jgi:UDP-glucose 4-epimerase
MRVLITGIAGGTGMIVAKRLAEAGHEVVGIDRRLWRDPPAGIEMFEIDIRKRAAEDVFRKLRPEVVVHMATVTHLVVKSQDRYRINLGGTRAVFSHAHAYGVKHVIFVGRHTYYGSASDSPLYHTEDEPPMAVTTFPELADLVAADLYAGTALWRFPELATSVLRMVYTLGPSGHGTLATFLKGNRVPMVLGFDPLYQFMHEEDVALAISKAIEARPRGVFNVAGPQPVPLSLLIKTVGRSGFPVPEGVLRLLMGRFGLPKIPAAAVTHLKFPVVIDDRSFRGATGYQHGFDEIRCMHEFRRAFPPPVST